MTNNESQTSFIKSLKLQEARLVVGIGASAGGLEALQQFFVNLPANSNLIYVIVQHLSPDYKSLMAEILGKYTPMQVVQAEHLMPVEPNTVYLIPPKKNLTIKAGHILLSDYDHRGINHPIDIFFNSLAEESREKAVAVVLSGTGSDGTNGIKTVKEHGGIVMAGDRKQGHTISRTEGARMAEQPGLDCQTIQRARHDLERMQATFCRPFAERGGHSEKL